LENESIIALGYKITECESTSGQQCSQLTQKRSDLITQHIQQLKGLDKLIRENRHKDDIFFDPTILGKIGEIVEATPNTVMIYPLVGERELHIQLYGKEGVVKTVPVPVGRVELGNAVKEFRSLMEKCEKIAYCGGEDITKVKAASKKLYGWLIKPIEKELNANPVENLVFALDRVTRYIPTSALFDGNQYLIEKYSIYVAPSADLTNTIKPSPSLSTGNTNILGMGLSDSVAQNGTIPAFKALKSVPKELDFIIKEQNDSSDKQGIYNGKTFLNSQFKFSTIQNNLKDNNVLHLATHGVFDPNSSQQSYILLARLYPKLRIWFS
jgi:CHAT domain-containing protein